MNIVLPLNYAFELNFLHIQYGRLTVFYYVYTYMIYLIPRTNYNITELGNLAF